MQAGSRFVEDIKRSAGVAFGEFGGEFEALGFAAGKGVCRKAALESA